MRHKADIPMSANGEAKSAMTKKVEPNAAPRSESVADENGIARDTATGKRADVDKSDAGQTAMEDTNALVVVHVSAKPAAIRGESLKSCWPEMASSLTKG